MTEIEYRKDLIDLLKFYKLPLVAAELGCAEGLFSKDLMDSGLDKLYMCDNWGTIEGITGDGNFPQEWHDNNYAQAMERVKGLNVQVLRGRTAEMAIHVPDKTLGMVYIDAGHTYEAVTADLNAWYSKVVDGGIIAGHDYLMPQYGVYEAVRDFTKDKMIQVHTIHEKQVCDSGFWFVKA